MDEAARRLLDLLLQAGDGSTLDNGVPIGNCTAPSDAAPTEAESVIPEFAESVKPEFNGAAEFSTENRPEFCPCAWHGKGG